MKYDTDYFINKFEAIPEELWCSQTFRRVYHSLTAHCALGHCDYENWKETDFGKVQNKEANALVFLFERKVTLINDGTDQRYEQPTPKQRILAALYDIKANEAVKEVQEIVNHPVKNAPKQTANAI